MFRRFMLLSLLVLAAFSVVTPVGVHAQSSSMSLQDIYFDYDVYYGVRQPIYDLYVVYDDDREELFLRYTDKLKRSDQMRDFSRGFAPHGVVDWYRVDSKGVAQWVFYSRYKNHVDAEGNADWLMDMGYETDIRMVYRPIFRYR